jgi:hypothetical protein
LDLLFPKRSRIISGMDENGNKPRKKRRKNPFAVALGRKGGLKGGPARAAKMTPEERSESARKAVLARWQRAKTQAA